MYTTEIKDLINHLLETDLTAEEFLLCYSVYITKEAPENRELLKLLTSYYSRISYYDRDGQPTGIAWSTIIAKLERDGFLVTYKGHSSLGKDGNYKLSIANLDVTDKFKNTVVTDQKESMWNYYVDEIYGDVLEINNTRTLTALPDKGETREFVQNLFWDICGNGLISKFQELCQNTKDYKEYMGLNMKITTFLKNYKEHVRTLKNHMQSTNYSDSY